MTKIPMGQYNVMRKLAGGQSIHQSTATNQFCVGSPETSYTMIQRPTFKGLEGKGYLKVTAMTKSPAGHVQSRSWGLSREGYRWCAANLDWTLGPDASEQERAAYQVYADALKDLEEAQS